MCGIAGTYRCPTSADSSMERDMQGMLSVIRHRGPDESGMYLDRNLAMGSVRLSIIDVASGQQPLCDDSGNYWIVYNGEIFNYEELRKDIQKKGVRLRTHCDTEVVVQMYAMYGPACLRYFNGQFAFCIWDKKEQELFFARDRVGIRPLFYWTEGNSFAFCSEIKGLFTLPYIKRALSYKSLSQIFTFWATVSPHTSFEGIYELPPAHYMRVKNSKVSIERYWTLDFPDDASRYSGSVTDAVEEFRHLLTDAVRLRLRADMPVAAYLSGGLDSSVTTSVIKEINPGSLHTFSIGFKDKEFDETGYQHEASEYFHTSHTSFECTSADIADHFSDTIWHTEAPVLRTAPTPMFLLSKRVRERNIKVVITGEGADEFLAGYNIFKEAKVRRFWAGEPGSVFRPRLLSRLYPYLPMMKGTDNITALKMFFGYKLTDTADPFYSHLLRWHNTSRIRHFFSENVVQSLHDYLPFEELCTKLPENFMSWSGLARSQYLEATVFMSQYLLSSQGDRVSMGNSVEGRYPFLDYRVIEFCNKLPDRFKLNCLNEKFLLKKMSAGKIPPSITHRSKQPYRAPITKTFLDPRFSDRHAGILSGEAVRSYGLFDPEKVASLLSKITLQQSLTETDQMAITGIVSTQLLYRKFIEKPVPADLQSLPDIKIIRGS